MPSSTFPSQVDGKGAKNGSLGTFHQQFLLDNEGKIGVTKNTADPLRASGPGKTLISQTKRNEEWTFMLFLCGFVTNVGACIPIGYSIGVLNTPQAIIRDFCNSTAQYRYGIVMGLSEMNVLWSAIVSISLVSGVVGSLSCSCLADKYGRKQTLLLSLVIGTVAAVFLTCSRWAYSIEMILLARLLLGYAGGLVTGVAPLYLTEIAPIGLRGFMGVLCPLGLSAGVLVAQVFGFSFMLGNESSWHYLIGLYILLTIPSIILFYYLPESPKYLFVVKGLKDEGLCELVRLRNKRCDELKDDLEELFREKAHQEENKIGKQFGIAQLIKSPQLRLPLSLVVLMQLGQQLSGINAVFYYSMTIFEQAGLGKSGSEMASVAAGAVNLAMAFLALKLVGSFTRRGLILASCISAASCLILLIFVIVYIDAFWWMPYLSIFAVLAYVVCFAFGLGPIPFFIGSELFEIGPRPAAMSLGSMANWGGNFTVGMTFPLLQQWLGPWAFAPFVVTTAALALFLNARLPETKGLDPVQVSMIFAEPRCLRCQQRLPSGDYDGEAFICDKRGVSTVADDGIIKS
ncbi:solute carrier family 2, facilitated glucose transporter member 1-like [Ischnura elegans]|uniref:solute carrier family 2, facilitated glucose transporter member 1-like n=1 Tax=Ischnura elegans TaxID=197161 RepID=UPI001ED87BAF|nr:solute carrier family 2, facilitated glucose transporter member 1-like [Ischnura elegans]